MCHKEQSMNSWHHITHTVVYSCLSLTRWHNTQYRDYTSKTDPTSHEEEEVYTHTKKVRQSLAVLGDEKVSQSQQKKLQNMQLGSLSKHSDNQNTHSTHTTQRSLCVCACVCVRVCMKHMQHMYCSDYVCSYSHHYLHRCLMYMYNILLPLTEKPSQVSCLHTQSFLPDSNYQPV